MDISYFPGILLICITGEQHYGSWIDPSQEAVDPPRNDVELGIICLICQSRTPKTPFNYSLEPVNG